MGFYHLKTFYPIEPLWPISKELTSTRLERIIDLLIEKYRCRIGFMRTNEDPFDETPYNAYGVTNRDRWDHIFIFLSYEFVIPLLRTDLTDAEKLGCQWRFAMTLFHELAVSVQILAP